MKNKSGIKLKKPVYITSSAAIVGAKEGEGPLKDSFDMILTDDRFGEKTWEAAESRLQKETAALAMNKAHLGADDIDYVFAGDLINQCVATHYGVRDFNIPFFGLYGACSTMTEALSLAAVFTSAGYGENSLALTSSHFCSAEKQFRYPLEYGGQRPPTAQWTATAAGCAVVSANGEGPRITYIMPGKIVDMGITDISNMGSAMAPAAVDTLSRLFRQTDYKPSDFDGIFTGDLGVIGSEILLDKLMDYGIDICRNHHDCGKMLFDIEKQDVHSGASGCGCMASVLCGHILPQMKNGKFKRIIAMATGALMNPTVILQGESIPAIAHAVIIENTEV